MAADDSFEYDLYFALMKAIRSVYYYPSGNKLHDALIIILPSGSTRSCCINLVSWFRDRHALRRRCAHYCISCAPETRFSANWKCFRDVIYAVNKGKISLPINGSMWQPKLMSLIDDRRLKILSVLSPLTVTATLSQIYRL